MEECTPTKTTTTTTTTTTTKVVTKTQQTSKEKNDAEDQILETLARLVLLIDKDNKPLIPLYEKTIADGLEKKQLPERKDVIIIGAGMAGLTTGLLLKDAGYNVTILEANDNRIGGRVKTFRHVEATADHKEKAPFVDKKQTAEAGAMRIPKTGHRLINKLVERLNLETQEFYNFPSPLPKQENDPNWGTWVNVNGKLRRKYDKDTNYGFPDVPEKFKKYQASDLLADALKDLVKLVAPTLPVEEQIKGWKYIIKNYDEYSIYRFLRLRYSETVCQYIGTLEDLSSRSHLSFMHSFVDTFYLSGKLKYYEIKGGNWKLPYAFLPFLKDNIVMNSRAIEIQWSDAPKAVHKGRRGGVYVKTVSEDGKKQSHYTADYLVISIPFSALRAVRISPLFSYKKRRAIQELHYDSSTKVLLEFSKRFWEWDEAEWEKNLPGTPYRGHKAHGGGSIDDSPNRFTFYPSHPVEGGLGGGVILASYTWSDEASFWDSMPKVHTPALALQGLKAIYGDEIQRFYTDKCVRQSWMSSPYSFGEAAVFTPSQFIDLFAYIPGPEGDRVHFTGEHTSMKHAWIEGALESAVRAALDIHNEATTHGWPQPQQTYFAPPSGQAAKL